MSLCFRPHSLNVALYVHEEDTTLQMGFEVV